DSKLVLFRNVVLLYLAIDGGHYGWRQFDASHEYVIKDDGVAHRDSVRLLAFVFHHLFGQAVLYKTPDFLLDFLACRRIDLFGSVLSDDFPRQTTDPWLH